MIGDTPDREEGRNAWTVSVVSRLETIADGLQAFGFAEEAQAVSDVASAVWFADPTHHAGSCLWCGHTHLQPVEVWEVERTP